MHSPECSSCLVCHSPLPPGRQLCNVDRMFIVTGSWSGPCDGNMVVPVCIWSHVHPANTRRSPNVGTMLVQRRRRWSNNKINKTYNKTLYRGIFITDSKIVYILIKSIGTMYLLMELYHQYLIYLPMYSAYTIIYFCFVCVRGPYIFTNNKFKIIVKVSTLLIPPICIYWNQLSL